MNAEPSLADRLSSEVKTLLSTGDQASLCNPVINVKATLPGNERPAIGAHLTDEADVVAVRQRLVAQILDIGHQVENAMTRAEPHIDRPGNIADANALLNEEATTPREVTDTETVPAHFIEAMTEVFLTASQRVDQMYSRLTAPNADRTYLFDIRLSETDGEPQRTLVKDMETLLKELHTASTTLKDIGALCRVHGAMPHIRSFEEEVQGALEMQRPGVSPVLPRELIHLERFKKIAAEPAITELTKQLAAYYAQAIHILTELMPQYLLLMNEEREEPGVVFAKDRVITRTYEERLSTFLDLFRLLIIAGNSAKRTLLLLECSRNEL